MARKKGEIQLQREIETQEEWEEVMAMEGLWVVDVYQEWCGPCQALVGNFRRLKNELGDPLLNYAIAKADTIDALEKYRGRCEPTFLFFAGGILTSYIHGANAPQVQKVITEQLASEHKILEGTGERKEVRDSVITRAEEIEIERLAEEEAMRIAEAAKYETKNKGITIAIIKPDAVAQGKVEEIITEIKEQGVEILTHEEKELTTEEAKLLYSYLEDEPYFGDLIRYMTSGPSHLLVLTKGESGMTVVKDWKEMIGPSNVEQAKEEAPRSLRAKYGEKSFINALHGSSSKEAAARELALLLPHFTVPTYQKKKENIQTTLALIRPETCATKSNAVLQKIVDAGFKITMLKEVQLTKEQAAEFYKEHENYAYFDSLVETMCSGPILALGLTMDDAIKVWKEVLGPSNIDDALEKAPNSLRAQFPGTSGINQIHGSDNEEVAKEELAYFFPMEQTVAVIKPHAMGYKDEIIAKIYEAGFRIAAQKETTISPEVVDTMYRKHADQSYYEDLINSLTSGPSLFLVLSREGAVSGWRQEIGDVDPEVARNQQPDSIRALYGIDLIRNAVHASSNLAHVKQEMHAVFGDLKFNEDGTVKGAQPDLDETSHVIEHDRTSDAGDVADEHSDAEPPAGETDDAALDRRAEDSQQGKEDSQQGMEDSQQGTDNETHDAGTKKTQRPDSPEGDTQTDTVHHDDKADDSKTDHTQAQHKRHGSDHDSEKIEAEQEERGSQRRADNNGHDEHEKAEVISEVETSKTASFVGNEAPN